MKRVTRKLKQYLIPHEGNDYKPHLLRPRAALVFSLVMAAAELVILLVVPYASTRSRLFGIIEVNALVDGTNANRVADNMPALTVNPLLSAAAQEKANDMVKNGYFAHTSPAGITPWYWFQNVGYGFSYAGENLAVNFSDSQDVTNAWMNSPEHRANILNSNYTNIGIAFATGTYEGLPATFVVELFGAPTLAPVIAATPATPTPIARTRTAIASKPKVLSPVPAIVSTTLVQTTSSQTSFVAVKGASMENILSTGTVPQPVPASAPLVTQNNPVQEAFASPREVSNDLYFLFIVLIAGALALNVFIKIRIQHPTLIFNGVFMIALAALCIVLNQHQLLARALIL